MVPILRNLSGVLIALRVRIHEPAGGEGSSKPISDFCVFGSS